MRKLIVYTLLVLGCTIITAQNKYLTKNGHISFYSHTTMEDIKADNNMNMNEECSTAHSM